MPAALAGGALPWAAAMEFAAVAVAARAARRTAAAILAAGRTAAQAAEVPQPADMNVVGAVVARIARARGWAMPPTRPNRRAAVAVPVEPSLGLPADARAQVRAALPARHTRPTVRRRCSDANGRRVLVPVPAAAPAPGFAAALHTPRRAAAAGRTPADSSRRPAASAE